MFLALDLSPNGHRGGRTSRKSNFAPHLGPFRRAFEPLVPVPELHEGGVESQGRTLGPRAGWHWVGELLRGGKARRKRRAYH